MSAALSQREWGQTNAVTSPWFARWWFWQASLVTMRADLVPSLPKSWRSL